MALSLKLDKVVFNKLDEYFLKNIKISLKTFNKIFILTKEDKFYEINIYDQKFLSFVLWNENSVIESMNVKDLSFKNIVDLSYGFCHYIARNDENKIFCWGNNSFGQLGIGIRDDRNISMDCIHIFKNDDGIQRNEVELNEFLSVLNIAVVKCGFWHSLALTQNFELYAWGSTSNDNEEMCQLTPKKLDGFGGEKVVIIACGYNHSLALSESGRVFSWGENFYGQLGNGNEIYRENPNQIELGNISIQKISCGQRHSLLLSNDGVIYAFGDNRFGQIGDGSKENQAKPVRLTHKNGDLLTKFSDIASSFMENISVALSSDNRFYIWGKCGREIHLTPYQTKCKSFEEVFSNFTFIQYMPSATLIEFNDLLFRNGYYESEYRVVDEIGYGSFGNVFKVSDKNENYFAIKIAKISNGLGKDFLREYINQFHVNMLVGEFFVEYLDSWFENKIDEKGAELVLYIKMELCDKTLDEFMHEIHGEFFRKEVEILSPTGYYLASEIFIQILKGVSCLHQHNIIHRDLKPSNILLKKRENSEIFVKIADFGLSVLHEFSEQSHTRDRGTIKYMAPEISSNKKYDTKVDIYSLGITLKNLFNIDITKDYTVDSERNCKLSNKYFEAQELFSKMANPLPSKRPICEVILNERHLWALNENELDIENELKSVIESELEERNSFIYSILETKFISILVKMIIKNDSNTIKALDVCENKPDFIRKLSNHLKDVVINHEMRTTAIDSIVGLMRKYPNFIEMQLNSIVCLYSLIENVLEEIKNTKQIQNAIEVTLKAMELYPNHQQLQKSALIFLYSERVLDNISTERKKCTKLVMDSLVNFKKTDMNFMASFICSTNLMELSIEERSELGSNVVYVETLLNILRVFDNSSYDLIQNTLSVLVNLLTDSSINCLNFTNLGGLEVAYTLLEKFAGDNNIEFSVLVLLYNIAEFPLFKNELLEQRFLSILRNLMHSPKINVSFFAAGILVQLFYVGIKSGENELFDSEIILDELMNVILNWKTLDKGCVSFVSFSSFQPLLASSVSPAVQIWTIWTIHHFCFENPKKYCEMLLKEIGIESLKAFHETSKTTKCEPLITLCEKTLEIFEREYFDLVSLPSPQIVI